MIKNYKEAVKYLEKFIDLGLFNHIDPKTALGDEKLNRIRVFLKKIGNPDTKYPSVIVSGTSGKGSTAYLIANLLVWNNVKVGLTISPHLQKINERIQIGWPPEFSIFNSQFSKNALGITSLINQISDDEFINLLNKIYPQLEEMKKENEGSLSFPEILFCMALKYFADKSVDIVIAEVGLEGKYDFTSILSPIGFVLTNVSLDHTKILGETVEKIAEEATAKLENLAIYKNRDLKPFVVTGVSQKTIIELIKKRAKKGNSDLKLLEKDFKYKVLNENKSGVEFEFKNDEILRFTQNDKEKFFVSILGKYQAENASLAIETIINLEKFGFKIKFEKVREALRNSFWPGRFELKKFRIQNSEFRIILDGAHNLAKMSAFLESLKNIYPNNPKIFICAFKKDKDIEKMLKLILNEADYLIITRFETTIDFGAKMSTSVSSMKHLVSNLLKNKKLKTKNVKKIDIFYQNNAKRALGKAIGLAKKFRKDPQVASPLRMTEKNQQIIVTTGSLYLVGEIRELLNR